MNHETDARRARILSFCAEADKPVTIAWLAHRLGMRGDTERVRQDVTALVAQGKLSSEVILTAVVDPGPGLPRSRTQKLTITWLKGD